MASFPNLEPSTRSYSLPRFPVTAQPAAPADPVLFLHGINPSGLLLELTYIGIPAVDAGLIRSHYMETSQPFRLSPAVSLGHGSLPIGTAGSLWVYAEPPQESHRSGNQLDVSVRLESVRGQLAAGAGLSISLSMNGGIALIGPNLTIMLTLSPGAASAS